MGKKRDEKITDEYDDRRPDAFEDDSIKPCSVSWWSLLNFTSKTHTAPFAVAILLSVASGIIIPTLAVLLGKLFEAFTNYGGQYISGPGLLKLISTYALGLVALGCTSGLLNATYFMSWLIFGELQARGAREQTFDCMLDQDMEWFDTRSVGIGTLVSQLQIRIRELQMATSQPLGFLTQYISTVLAALGLAVYYSWTVTLVTLGTIPFWAIVLSWISKHMQPAIEAQNERLAQASKVATSAITAIETVKCFNGQEHELSQYASIVKEAARYGLVQARWNALQIGFVRLAILAMFVQGFWYGSHLVNIGQKAPGDILTCFWACLMATQTVEQILPQIIVLEKGRVAGAALGAIVPKTKNNKEDLKTTEREAPLNHGGDIEVRNVRFSYPSRPDQLTLNGSSFFFATGKTTFVVGRSGSGKSTLSNLLMRFYDPRSGDILIDGHSIQALDINWLRNHITLVQQESVLFSGSVFSNIECGKREQDHVRKGDVKRAIDMAFLQDTIKRMPRGIDTVVGAGGSGMSGGQRQRMALARARLRNAPVLILDEATSALDHVTKSYVLERMRRWRIGKTTIIITHDLSQILSEDYVYVLDQGVVVQEGFRKSLEEDCTTGAFGWLAMSSSTSPPPQMTKLCPDEVTATAESVLMSSSLTRDSVDIHVQTRNDHCSSAISPTSPHLQDSRASRGFMSQRSPAASLLSRISFATPAANPSNTPDIPLISSSRPSMEVSDASPMFVTHTDIEMQPMVRHSGSSLTLNAQVAEWTRRLTKAWKAAKEPQATPLEDILLTIWPTLSFRKRVALILGFTAALFHAAATPVFSYVFSQLLSTFYLTSVEARAYQAYVYSLSILGIAAIDSSASYFMHYLLESCGQQWIDSLRIRAYRNILDQPMAFFSLNENSTEKLVEVLDRNTEETRNILSRFAAFVFVVITMMAIAVIWSTVVSWRLTLVGLGSAPFLYGLTRGFESISGRWEARSNSAASLANAIFKETFSNIRTVRAYTLEAHFHGRYTRATASAFHTGLQRAMYSGVFFGLSDTGIVFVTALVFYYGAHLVASGTHTVTEILTVFTTLLFSMANVNAIVALIPQIASSRATATSLLRLASLPYDASHESTGTYRPTSIHSIRFDHTTFTYQPLSPPTHPSSPTPPTIINNLTLSLSPHTSTALTGPSGTGKSTLASLLFALHRPTSGSILLNDIPLSIIHTPTLRSLIAIVPQHPTLFPGISIAANIAYPDDPDFDPAPNPGSISTSTSASFNSRNPAAVAARIHVAARMARIHDFITTLPDGYRTLLGPGTSSSSNSHAGRHHNNEDGSDEEEEEEEEEEEAAAASTRRKGRTTTRTSTSTTGRPVTRTVRTAGALSGGQAQRLTLARALYRQPQLLILDEATSALDRGAAEGVREIVEEVGGRRRQRRQRIMIDDGNDDGQDGNDEGKKEGDSRDEEEGDQEEEEEEEEEEGERWRFPRGCLVITHDGREGGMLGACRDVVELG